MNDNTLKAARLRLLDEIEQEAAETAQWTGRQAFSQAVMAAMAKVPRHEFVPLEERSAAYINRPLPIGHGQTISQPYMVAVMTDLLDIDHTSRVLEIGTGCGYQAAVLAEVAGEVFSIEIVEALASATRARLKRLGYETIQVRHGDGYAGWPEEAPFDAIIVTAAPETIPAALIEQLKPGGRMVIPTGHRYQAQSLRLCTKDLRGTFTEQASLPVAFVPMVHGKP